MFSATAFAGVGSVLAKVAYAGGFEPMPLLAVRFLIAAVLLTPFALRRRSQISALSRPLFVQLAVVALANLVASWFFFNGLAFAPVSVVTLAFFTYPAMVLLVTRVLGEGIALRHVSAIVAGWSGIWFLLGGDFQANLRAVAYGLGAAVAFATYVIAVASVLERIGVIANAVIQFALLAVGAGILWVLTGQHVATTWQGWVAAGAFALVSTVVARVAYYSGVKRIGSRYAALFGLGEPLAAVLSAGLILGERLELAGWIGAALILVSSTWSLKSLNRSQTLGKIGEGLRPTA